MSTIAKSIQKSVQVYNLGRLEYSKCLKIQKHFFNKHLEQLDSPDTNEPAKDTLLLVEHDPPVYTVGMRRAGYPEHELERLRQLNAQVEKTDRGGLITFHGPGQLVAYPILNLKSYKPSVKWYVSQLESVIIDLCKSEYSLNAHRLCNIGYTGVWANNTKLAAIGVHYKRYVTYHGLALNCDVDLSWFKHIVPCGIEDKAVSSLSEQLKRPVGVDQVIPLFLKHFQSRFEVELQRKSEEETKELILQTSR